MHPSYVPHVSLADYRYDLPPERIAPVPLEERDRSRLLHYEAGVINDRTFADLPSLLPSGAMLVLNDTKVVRARIVMHRGTGGRIEFLLLTPVEPSHDPAVALAAVGETVWSCMVGGARKFERGGEVSCEYLHDGRGDRLRALYAGRDNEGYLVRFSWGSAATFADVLQSAGRVPLPPYIRRDATDADVDTYQTVYAEVDGSVAAPALRVTLLPSMWDSTA